MALGKIKADTLEPSTAGSLDTQYVVRGSAKVWLRSTDAAVLTQSFNVSSGTDNAAGNYTYAFTNSFNYSADHGGIGAMAGPDNAYFRKAANDGPAGSLQVRGVTAPGTGGGPAGVDTECSLTIHGDLA